MKDVWPISFHAPCIYDSGSKLIFLGPVMAVRSLSEHSMQKFPRVPKTGECGHAIGKASKRVLYGCPLQCIRHHRKVDQQYTILRRAGAAQPIGTRRMGLSIGFEEFRSLHGDEIASRHDLEYMVGWNWSGILWVGDLRHETPVGFYGNGNSPSNARWPGLEVAPQELLLGLTASILALLDIRFTRF